MNFKDYLPEQWTELTTKLDQAITTMPGPHYAAFDADGTLWSHDVGESFFKYQIANCPLQLPPDPWRHYREWKDSGDPRPAYLWLAQINSGQSLETIRQWAEAFVRSTEPLPIFEPQKRLIDWLQKRGVKVYVVTASVKWAVEPAAKRVNIPFEQVLGVETEIENGIITNQQKGTITYRAGKLEKLLDATGGVTPLICSGNSLGDWDLLMGAKIIRLAVRSTMPGEEMYQPEQELYKKAVAANWYTHSFV